LDWRPLRGFAKGEANVQINSVDVVPNQLLLDPNNYRFHDLSGYKPVSRARFAEQGVQDRALQFLKDNASFDLSALRDSIISNGFVPFEQIVVERYNDSTEQPLFLVIEGNRRTASIKTIIDDHKGGAVTLRPDVLESLENFKVIEIIGTEQERANYQKTLMAIRHVAGIREWGPYQQARLVVEMYEKEEKAFGPVAQRIGITTREVARRYRASKALEQMEKDEEFGEFADPKLYSFFHEAVSQPKVREWLNFSDQTYQAENENARRTFYELLSPREIDGAKMGPKLQNANKQVRQLKEIVDKPIPLKILSDPERSFDEAVRAAEQETPKDETGVLEHSLGLALNALKEPSIDAWLSPDENARQIWNEIVGLVEKVKGIILKNDTP
jgi:hypothetical protein